MRTTHYDNSILNVRHIGKRNSLGPEPIASDDRPFGDANSPGPPAERQYPKQRHQDEMDQLGTTTSNEGQQKQTQKYR